MTSEQQAAHQRMLATLQITNHIKMFNPNLKQGGPRLSGPRASANGRLGKLAAGSVPVFKRKKRL